MGKKQKKPNNKKPRQYSGTKSVIIALLALPRRRYGEQYHPGVQPFIHGESGCCICLLCLSTQPQVKNKTNKKAEGGFSFLVCYSESEPFPVPNQC